MPHKADGVHIESGLFLSFFIDFGSVAESLFDRLIIRMGTTRAESGA
jgi:hypothetical protein